MAATFTQHDKTIIISFDSKLNLQLVVNVFGEERIYDLNSCNTIVMPAYMYPPVSLINTDLLEIIATPDPEVIPRDDVNLWNPLEAFEDREDGLANMWLTDKDNVTYSFTNPEDGSVQETDLGMIMNITVETIVTLSAPAWVKLLIGEMEIDGNSYVPNPRQRDIKSDIITITKVPAQLQITTALLDI